MLNKNLKENKQARNINLIGIYCLFRLLIIICMVLEVIHGEMSNALICFLSLIILMLPLFLERKFKVKKPTLLEIILLLSMLIIAVLNTINDNSFLYVNDQIIKAILIADIGLSLVTILNKNILAVKLSPLYIVIFSFCVAMSIGTLEELFEYFWDNNFHTNMQKEKIIEKIIIEDEKKKSLLIKNIKYINIYYENNNGEIMIYPIKEGYLDIGLNDTMKDLLIIFSVSIILNICGYYYLENKNKFKYLKHFILKREELPL